MYHALDSGVVCLWVSSPLVFVASEPQVTVTSETCDNVSVGSIRIVRTEPRVALLCQYNYPLVINHGNKGNWRFKNWESMVDVPLPCLIPGRCNFYLKLNLAFWSHGPGERISNHGETANNNNNHNNHNNHKNHS